MVWFPPAVGIPGGCQVMLHGGVGAKTAAAAAAPRAAGPASALFISRTALPVPCHSPTLAPDSTWSHLGIFQTHRRQAVGTRDGGHCQAVHTGSQLKALGHGSGVGVPHLDFPVKRAWEQGAEAGSRVAAHRRCAYVSKDSPACAGGFGAQPSRPPPPAPSGIGRFRNRPSCWVPCRSPLANTCTHR